MKHTLELALLCSFAIAAPTFTSCSATQGHERASHSVDTLEDLRDSVSAVQSHTAEVMKSLAELSTRSSDAKSAYSDFADAEEDLNEEHVRSGKLLLQARVDTQRYIGERETQSAQIANASMRDADEERRDALNEAIDEVGAAMNTANGEFTPFARKLSDLRMFLSNDLSARGLEAVDSSLVELQSEAKDVQREMSKVIEAIDGARKNFRAARPAGKR